MKQAFTMIELIFIIVIIGILASVAIPKLAATRDDAINVTLKSNAAICIRDLISGYRGAGMTLTITEVDSCNKAIAQGASISYNNGNVRVSGVGSDIDGDYSYAGTRVSI